MGSNLEQLGISRDIIQLSKELEFDSYNNILELIKRDYIKFSERLQSKIMQFREFECKPPPNEFIDTETIEKEIKNQYELELIQI